MRYRASDEWTAKSHVRHKSHVAHRDITRRVRIRLAAAVFVLAGLGLLIVVLEH